MTETEATSGKVDQAQGLPSKDAPLFMMTFPNLAEIDDLGNINLLGKKYLSLREAAVVTGLTREKILAISKGKTYLDKKTLLALTTSKDYTALRATELRLSQEQGEPVWVSTRIMQGISSSPITGRVISQIPNVAGIEIFTAIKDRRSYRLLYRQSDTERILSWGKITYPNSQNIHFPPNLTKKSVADFDL